MKNGGNSTSLLTTAALSSFNDSPLITTNRSQRFGGDALAGSPTMIHTSRREQVLICLLGRMNLMTGTRGESFLKQAQLLAAASAAQDNWHMIHVGDRVTLYSPENDLAEVMAESRRFLMLPGPVPDHAPQGSRTLFGVLSDHYCRQIGLGTLTRRITSGHSPPGCAQRLAQHLVDWAKDTMLGTPSFSEIDESIEKTIEFDVYDLLEHTRSFVPAQNDAPPLPGGRELAFGAPNLVLPQMLAWLKKHYSEPDLTASRMAEEFRISVRQVHKLFELRPDGQTFLQTLKSIRMSQAQAFLENPDFWHLSIADVAERCGFSNSVYFGRVFREEFGLAPGAYRRQKKEAFYRTCAFLAASHTQGSSDVSDNAA